MSKKATFTILGNVIHVNVIEFHLYVFIRKLSACFSFIFIPDEFFIIAELFLTNNQKSFLHCQLPTLVIWITSYEDRCRIHDPFWSSLSASKNYIAHVPVSLTGVVVGCCCCCCCHCYKRLGKKGLRTLDMRLI